MMMMVMMLMMLNMVYSLFDFEKTDERGLSRCSLQPDNDGERYVQFGG